MTFLMRALGLQVPAMLDEIDRLWRLAIPAIAMLLGVGGGSWRDLVL